jgi:hypothetical protein
MGQFHEATPPAVPRHVAIAAGGEDDRPVVPVYAGRRDRSEVAHRARRLLAGLGPSGVVGSAPEGADLLGLEATLEGREHAPMWSWPALRRNLSDVSAGCLATAPPSRSSVPPRCRASSASDSLTGPDAYAAAKARMLQSRPCSCSPPARSLLRGQRVRHVAYPHDDGGIGHEGRSPHGKRSLCPSHRVRGWLQRQPPPPAMDRLLPRCHAA